MPARTASKIGGQSTARRDLLADIQKNLDEGWRQFIDIYAPTVHRFSRCAGLRSADADEVLSEVLRNLLRFFRNGGVIDSQKGHFRNYLREVINNAIRLQKRKNQRRSSGVELPEETAEDAARLASSFESIERQERLRAELDKLFSAGEPRHRDLVVFECYAIERESVEDVADWFNISEGRVYAIKHEIIQLLRQRIEAEQQRERDE